MADFTIVAMSAHRGSEQAELDVVVASFDPEAEAIGYARRMAEESQGLAEQLDLDPDYSNVCIYAGEVDEQKVDPEHPSFLGMWFFTDDGVEWATAQTLREMRDNPSEEQVA